MTARVRSNPVMAASCPVRRGSYGWMDGVVRFSLRSLSPGTAGGSMAIESGTGWRLVSDSEFQDFLRCYPRPLTANPPLSQKARFRRFLAPSLDPCPTSQVATVHRSHRSTVIVILADLMPSAEERGAKRSGPRSSSGFASRAPSEKRQPDFWRRTSTNEVSSGMQDRRLGTVPERSTATWRS